MKKLLSFLLVCAMLLSCTAALAEDTTIRVTWWGGAERTNATIEALDIYGADAGVTMAYEYTSWPSYFENLATQAVGANLPDIIQMSTTNLVNYSENGQVIDLYPLVDAGLIDLSSIERASLAGGEVNGKLAGFPTGTNTVSVYYNKAVFDKAGVAYPTHDWTWNEFLNIAKTVYEATGCPSDVPFVDDFRWAAEAIVRSYGVDFFSADGKSLAWAENEQVINGLVKALNDITEGIKAGYLINPEEQLTRIVTEDNPIVKDESSLTFMLSNMYPIHAQIAKSELGIVMLPKMDDGIQSGMYLYPNMYWCISANSKNPEAAAAAVNYLINDTGAAKKIGTDRGVSLSATVRDYLANDPEGDPNAAKVLKYIGEVSAAVSTVTPADPAKSAELLAVLKNNVITVCYGEMSAEDCIADFIEQSYSILAN